MQLLICNVQIQNIININLNQFQAQSVYLRETDWEVLDRSGPRPASKSDLLKVLSKLDSILVRASHYQDTYRVQISDVILDVAVHQTTRNGAVHDVEICRCPQGYSGSSCEVKNLNSLLMNLIDDTN